MGTRGFAVTAALVLVCAAVALLLTARGASAQEDGELTLPGCGISYPGGYDLNTVGSVDGRVLAIEVPEKGPVRLMVAAEKERWVVLASPAWFWRMADPQLDVGAPVRVRGSKTLGADGTLYVIASEIRLEGTGAVTLLRARSGSPLWKGNRRGGGRRGGSGGGPGFGF